jgi:hypothetical protein
MEEGEEMLHNSLKPVRKRKQLVEITGCSEGVL